MPISYSEGINRTAEGGISHRWHLHAFEKGCRDCSCVVGDDAPRSDAPRSGESASSAAEARSGARAAEAELATSEELVIGAVTVREFEALIVRVVSMSVELVLLAVRAAVRVGAREA